MKIAIAKDGNVVSGHFGHCEGFEVFNVDGKTVNKREFLQNPGHKPGFLPRYLGEQGVDVIIAGGMGATAQELFAENGVNVVVGACGNLDDVIKTYLDGDLKSTGSVCREHAHEGECGN
ncbi:MAG: NifB/NifX family molybdenum-iron cluster-binding protein [Anaeromicrobium sp.]|jgi:predicted Fe-Mo cluster-binding NifX family protein|uniref:NifB/NifX family molybdenum-iron cluster-binding protein n=1 Tax=Anaeromicrobium sp. TaxID=1929132 RepID=UPI00260018A6|nr:NifB/NifX family molybdenum-iron cluster-binding protein [Anaeromicrobium sp.]MCT4595864.1 NifB/NifX family molybdenum-iron cluster-binding protein [Anaeromicrobium sp.]